MGQNEKGIMANSSLPYSEADNLLFKLLDAGSFKLQLSTHLPEFSALSELLTFQGIIFETGGTH